MRNYKQQEILFRMACQACQLQFDFAQLKHFWSLYNWVSKVNSVFLLLLMQELPLSDEKKKKLCLIYLWFETQEAANLIFKNCPPKPI